MDSTKESKKHPEQPKDHNEATKEGWEQRNEKKEVVKQGYDPKIEDFKPHEKERTEKLSDTRQREIKENRRISRDCLRKSEWGDKQEQIIKSGRDMEPHDFKKGDRLVKISSKGRDQQDLSSPHWMTEKEFERKDAKTGRSLREEWENGNREECKQKLALPCNNRCDSVVVAEVQNDCKGIKAEINPAKEKLYYKHSSEPEIKEDGIRYRNKDLRGGGEQVIPPHKGEKIVSEYTDKDGNKKKETKYGPNENLKIVETRS